MGRHYMVQHWHTVNATNSYYKVFKQDLFKYWYIHEQHHPGHVSVDLVTVFISHSGKSPIWKQDSTKGKVSYACQGSLLPPKIQTSRDISRR